MTKLLGCQNVSNTMSSVEFRADYRKSPNGLLKDRDHPFLQLARQVAFPNWDVMRGRGLREADEKLSIRRKSSQILLEPCVSRSSLVRQLALQDERVNDKRECYRKSCPRRRSSDNELYEFIQKPRSDSSVVSDSSSSVRSMTSSSTDKSPRPSRRVVKSLRRKSPPQQKTKSVRECVTKAPSLKLSKRKSQTIDFSKSSSGVGDFSEASQSSRLETVKVNVPRLVKVTPAEEGSESAIAWLRSLLVHDSNDTLEDVSSSLKGKPHQIVEGRRSGASTERKLKDPSHYKGLQRGSYLPDYDPLRTARRGSHLFRTNSDFALNDAKLYDTFRQRMLWPELHGNTLSQQLEVQGYKKDPDSKFRHFLNEKRHILEREHPPAAAHSAVNCLPTVRNGRSTSIIKSLSLDNLDEVGSESFESDLPRNIKLSAKATNEFYLPAKDRVHFLKTELRHHSTESAISSDSDSSTPSNGSAKFHRSLSTDPLAKMNLSHADVSRTGSASRLLPHSPKTKRKSKLGRVMSAIDCASEENIASLNSKHEHAKRQASRANSARSPISDRRGFGGQTKTALHEAVKSGNTALAQKLVCDGADVNALDAHGMPPFHYALAGGHYDCVALLLTSGANISEYFKGRRVKYFK